MTTVINILDGVRGDAYIGRGAGGKIPDYPGYGWAGNPFVLRTEDERDDCVAKYREYFYERLATDENFKNAIHSLEGKTLACYCKPKSCHGDVIVEYLNLERHKQMAAFPEHTQLGVEDFKELQDGELFIAGNILCRKSGANGVVVVHRAKKNQEGEQIPFNEDDNVVQVRLTGETERLS